MIIYPEETTGQINHCDNTKCVELRIMNVRNNTQLCCSHVHDMSSGRVQPPYVFLDNLIIINFFALFRISCFSGKDVVTGVEQLPADAVEEYVSQVESFTVKKLTGTYYLVRYRPQVI